MSRSPTATAPLFSHEAECEVVGGLLIAPETFSVVKEFLGIGDFYSEPNRVVYRTVERMVENGEPIGHDTLFTTLQVAGELEAAGGVKHLGTLFDYVPSTDPERMAHHARIVREFSLQRQTADVAAALLKDPSDFTTLKGTLTILADQWEEVQGGASGARRFPVPLGVADLLGVPEPEDQWLFEGLVPLDGNLLIGGYPKSHKTNFILEAAVAAASATPFLSRFAVPCRHRVGVVLMEDRPHRVRKRLQRICQARGIRLSDLDGWLYIWFRPPLRLGHAPTMRELANDVEAYELDVLLLDNWALVSDGNPDKAEEVTPQLHALSTLREIRPLTVGLVHHARKTGKDTDSTRLTDAMRGSGSFGAWYDAGVVLSRISETSPVGVRAELRDLPSPEPFSFTVEDEFPAGPDTGRQYPDGYLRLVASDLPIEVVVRSEKAQQLAPDVEAYLRDHPGCSKHALEKGVSGKAAHIREAFDLLISDGKARYEEPSGAGKAGRCYPTSGNLVPPRPNLVPDEGTNPCAQPRPLVPPPEGGDEDEVRGSGGTAAGEQPGRTPAPLDAAFGEVDDAA